LAHHQFSTDDVLQELARRQGLSGLAEKPHIPKNKLS
ncbi:phosphoribosyl-ATP pyrophosphatase, partial [Kingella kingae]|nr:phosphoribosyl-ATP pyrophosphatase [Kingella kingae]